MFFNRREEKAINIKEKYKKRAVYFEEDAKQKSTQVRTIGNLRLLTFIVGIGITAYTYIMKSYFASSILFILSAAIFVYLIKLHEKTLREKRYSEELLKINHEAVKRVSGEWKSFNDDGREFIDENHAFSGDLDIFGKASLFQWLNMCGTHNGRKKLAYLLTNQLKSKKDITERQEAVLELADKLEWRHEFAAETRLISEKTSDPEKLVQWALLKNELYLRSWLIIFCRVLPAITISLIVASFVKPIIFYKIALAFIAVQILMLIPRNVERVLSLNTVYKFKENIAAYESLLNFIEKQKFKSLELNTIRDKVINANNGSATIAIIALKRISDRIADRNNLFYIIINIIFLWDYQCMFQVEKWKKSYGEYLVLWIDAIGEFEALSSLAIVAHDNPSWKMAEIKDDKVILKAKALAHPLLGEEKVSNNIIMEDLTNIILITGSNMSGKSTFLRTVGINLILSYIGVPACAESFSCSIMNVYTCMRMGDNLEKSISSFYAEILRIKMIVEAAKEGKRIFFLLDEIFKGTNSIDRHIGAKLLIKQLGNSNAAGLISTHDLELGEMEKEYIKIKNYHFQEYYSENELKFDYKLRRGVSTTRNAMHIMKMAGIDTDKY